ncbi:MAG: hypothetical protein GYA52_07700 [Chloroflexi bacterium]|nr:hypothetical protein [Chloroflexota bacterium]
MKRKIFILLITTFLLAASGCSKTSNQVTATNNDRSGNSTLSAEAAMESFFSDYLDYFEDPDTGAFRNPLVDRVFANRHYVTRDFIDEIDEIIAAFDSGGAYDPIVCGQAVPDYITFDDPLVGPGMVTYMIKTNFEDQYFFVHLVKEADGWKINTISCY